MSTTMSTAMSASVGVSRAASAATSTAGRKAHRQVGASLRSAAQRPAVTQRCHVAPSRCEPCGCHKNWRMVPYPEPLKAAPHQPVEVMDLRRGMDRLVGDSCPFVTVEHAPDGPGLVCGLSRNLRLPPDRIGRADSSGTDAQVSSDHKRSEYPHNLVAELLGLWKSRDTRLRSLTRCLHVQNTMPAKVVVLGGNGFVGSEVCKEALQQGMTVVSINRYALHLSPGPIRHPLCSFVSAEGTAQGGRDTFLKLHTVNPHFATNPPSPPPCETRRSGPPAVNEPWVDRVDWVNADVFDEGSWAYTLPGIHISPLEPFAPPLNPDPMAER
eukprot:18003-Prorocentrum_minimum.AAC.1